MPVKDYPLIISIQLASNNRRKAIDSLEGENIASRRLRPFSINPLPLTCHTGTSEYPVSLKNGKLVQLKYLMRRKHGFWVRTSPLSPSSLRRAASIYVSNLLPLRTYFTDKLAPTLSPMTPDPSLPVY